MESGSGFGEEGEWGGERGGGFMRGGVGLTLGECCLLVGELRGLPVKTNQHVLNNKISSLWNISEVYEKL